jgi:hypothetical protein
MTRVLTSPLDKATANEDVLPALGRDCTEIIHPYNDNQTRWVRTGSLCMAADRNWKAGWAKALSRR